jgi:hypothetical protein
MRRVRVVPFTEIEDELLSCLSMSEFMDLLELDLLVNGQPRDRPDVPPVWLAVEISAVIDRRDMERARRRTALLRRAGYQAIPTVAGKQATDWMKEQALDYKMLLLQDGGVYFWEEALREALSD